MTVIEGREGVFEEGEVEAVMVGKERRETFVPVSGNFSKPVWSEGLQSELWEWPMGNHTSFGNVKMLHTRMMLPDSQRLVGH